MPDTLLVLTNLPDAASAERIAGCWSSSASPPA
jgi:hypothetical protein